MDTEKQRPLNEKKDQSRSVQEQIGVPGDAAQEVMEGLHAEIEKSKVPWYHSSQIARILILVYSGVVLIFGVLAWWVHLNPVLPIDIFITQEFQEKQQPALKGLMLFVSAPGSFPFVLTTLIVLTAVAFWILRMRLEASILIVNSIVSGILNVLIKTLVGRPRPTANLVDIFQVASGLSFPSGHVMSYVAFWGLLFSFGIILFNRRRWWHFVLLVICAFFVVMVGPSRIYLGDHWASDVLGAYMIGGVLLGIVVWAYLYLRARGVLAPRGSFVGER